MNYEEVPNLKKWIFREAENDGDCSGGEIREHCFVRLSPSKTSRTLGDSKLTMMHKALCLWYVGGRVGLERI